MRSNELFRKKVRKKKIFSKEKNYLKVQTNLNLALGSFKIEKKKWKSEIKKKNWKSEFSEKKFFSSFFFKTFFYLFLFFLISDVSHIRNHWKWVEKYKKFEKSSWKIWPSVSVLQWTFSEKFEKKNFFSSKKKIFFCYKKMFSEKFQNH